MYMCILLFVFSVFLCRFSFSILIQLVGSFDLQKPSPIWLILCWWRRKAKHYSTNQPWKSLNFILWLQWELWCYDLFSHDTLEFMLLPVPS